MLHIKLVVFGKLKEAYLRQACAEYEKRLGAYCKLETIELTPAPLPEKPTPAQIEQALAAEAKSAGEKILKNASVVALCVEGRQMSSEQFAAWIGTQPNAITILAGSSFGLDDFLKAKADLRLSMSEMTFPHQLARVMLLEQLYRALNLNHGGKYHK